MFVIRQTPAKAEMDCTIYIVKINVRQSESPFMAMIDMIGVVSIEGIVGISI